MHSPERQIHDRLGSVLYRLATIEQRANEVSESPRAVSKLLGEVRKMTAELQRSFSELQDLMARSTVMEQSARTAIARANLMFQLSPVACLVLEPVGIVVDANTAAARLLNVSHRHLVGKSFPLFLSRNREVFAQRIADLRAEDEPQRWESVLRPRERSVVACVFVAAPDPDGRVLLMLLPGTTVTELDVRPGEPAPEPGSRDGD